MIPALCCLAYPRASITLCYYNYNCWCSGIANMGTAMLKATLRQDTKTSLWEHLIQLPILSPAEMNLRPQQLNKKHEEKGHV